MEHNIKIREDFVIPVLNKEKTFEIRENDRGYQKGDTVRFTVVNSEGKPFAITKEALTLEKMTFEITYVISGWGLKNGYVCFGIRERGE